MNFRNFFFSLATTVTLLESGVFAQTTHMGVPAKDMVVLTANCGTGDPAPPCESPFPGIGKTTSGKTYRRHLADGTTEPVDFSIPERKILVITDYEWRYSEAPVTEESTNDPLDVTIALASTSQSNLRVTP